MEERLTNTSGDSAAVLTRLRAGDGQALAELFSMHRERLWRTVRFRLDRRLLRRVDPDDVLQEAYLAAADRIEHFVSAADRRDACATGSEGRCDSSVSFYVWLRMVVTQTMIDVHRRHLGAQMRDPRREVPLGGRLPQATSSCLAIQLSGKLTSPTQAAIRDERAGQLEQSLEQMDPIDREVLALRHFEELTNSEVAEVLGIQQKAASIRDVRAVRRLKVVLSEVPGFSDDDRKET